VITRLLFRFLVRKRLREIVKELILIRSLWRILWDPQVGPGQPDNVLVVLDDQHDGAHRYES